MCNPNCCHDRPPKSVNKVVGSRLNFCFVSNVVTLLIYVRASTVRTCMCRTCSFRSLSLVSSRIERSFTSFFTASTFFDAATKFKLIVIARTTTTKKSMKEKHDYAHQGHERVDESQEVGTGEKNITARRYIFRYCCGCYRRVDLQKLADDDDHLSASYKIGSIGFSTWGPGEGFVGHILNLRMWRLVSNIPGEMLHSVHTF